MAPLRSSRPVKKPTRAIVLAAGLGTRMHPVTATLPKALLPFEGTPLLERSIQLLQSWGVQDILINAHAHAEQVMAFCRDYSHEGCRICCSYEPTVLGTGGVLRRAEWFINEDPFWLINADIVADLDPLPLRKELARPDRIAALWMVPDKGPRTVDVMRNRVACFRSSRPGSPGTATFSGLHLLHPDILRFIPREERFASIVTAYEKAMKAGRPVGAASVEGSFWADVGTPEQYLSAHEEWRRFKRKRPIAFNWIHPEASVDSHARVSNSVVFKGARIKRHAHLDRAVVAPGTVVGQSGTRLLAPVNQLVTEEERSVLQKLGLGDSDCCAEGLSPRGSAREFYRISRGRKSVMLIRHDPERKENTLYGTQARLLRRAGLPVFQVHGEGQAEHFLVVDDLGRTALLDKVTDASSSLKMAWYRRAIEVMHEFHLRTAVMKGRRRLPLMPSFTPRLYGMEHDLFIREFLPLVDEEKQAAALLPELRRGARSLSRLHRVVVHRDYQSTNLMVHQRKLWLIDFQSMRKGPAVHDLASLLLDPYVALSREEVERLLDVYRGLPGNDSFEVRSFHLAGAQRLVQALGAYGRLSKIPGCEHFLDHIPVALRRLAGAARGSGQLPGLAEWASRFTRSGKKIS